MFGSRAGFPTLSKRVETEWFNRLPPAAQFQAYLEYDPEALAEDVAKRGTSETRALLHHRMSEYILAALGTPKRVAQDKALNVAKLLRTSGGTAGAGTSGGQVGRGAGASTSGSRSWREQVQQLPLEQLAALYKAVQAVDSEPKWSRVVEKERVGREEEREQLAAVRSEESKREEMLRSETAARQFRAEEANPSADFEVEQILALFKRDPSALDRLLWEQQPQLAQQLRILTRRPNAESVAVALRGLWGRDLDRLFHAARLLLAEGQRPLPWYVPPERGSRKWVEAFLQDLPTAPELHAVLEQVPQLNVEALFAQSAGDVAALQARLRAILLDLDVGTLRQLEDALDKHKVDVILSLHSPANLGHVLRMLLGFIYRAPVPPSSEKKSSKRCVAPWKSTCHGRHRSSSTSCTRRHAAPRTRPPKCHPSNAKRAVWHARRGKRKRQPLSGTPTPLTRSPDHPIRSIKPSQCTRVFWKRLCRP